MIDIAFKVERLTDIIDELKPLLEQHWQEIAGYKDQFPLNPDYDKYRAMDSAGLVHAVTVREDGALIGYYISFVLRHLHYQDCLVAMNDILFIRKDRRHGMTGSRMIRFAEKMLKEIGVNRMIMHVKVHHDFGRMLVKMGFTETEKNYEKLLNGRAQ